MLQHMFSYGSIETVKEHVQRKTPDCNHNNAGKAFVYKGSNSSFSSPLNPLKTVV